MASDIVGCSVNEVFYQACKLLSTRGLTNSRNGLVYRMNNVEICLHDPKSRHLALTGRKNNIIACMAETLWVMSGSDKIDPFLSFFLPRAKDYSDDGETWRGGYGPRIYLNGQIDDISTHINNEGPETRRNVLGIWNSLYDTQLVAEGSKDIPCNSAIWLWVEDKELMMKVQSRSGDILWGLLNINIFEWTFLQEVIRCLIRNNTGHNLDLGKYYHGCIDAHLYKATSEQAHNVMKNFTVVNQPDLLNYSVEIGTLIKTQDGLKFFFEEIVRLLTIPIVEDIKSESSFKSSMNEIKWLFDSHTVPCPKNQLYGYVVLSLYYIYLKKYGIDMQHIFNDIQLSPDVRNALSFCKFINWR